MAKRLSEKQYAAVALLSLPQRGGLTYEEVAARVGIARSTLQEWRKDDAFNEEIKRQVMRNSVEHLPSIIESIPKHIIVDGNAAMLRTFLQALGMLTEKVEVESKDSGRADIDEIKARIAALRQAESTE